jgi:hypothetical protein
MTALAALVLELNHTEFGTILQALAITQGILSKLQNLRNSCATLQSLATEVQSTATQRKSFFRKAAALDLETDIWDPANDTSEVTGKTGYLGGSLDSLIVKLTTNQGTRIARKKKKFFFFFSKLNPQQTQKCSTRLLFLINPSQLPGLY